MTSDDLRRGTERYQRASPALREAFHASAMELALGLADERDALVKRLETRWRWCDANTGHAAFVEREDAVLDDLARYEAMEDALRDAADALFGVAA